jgi:hypothetical protein
VAAVSAVLIYRGQTRNGHEITGALSASTDLASWIRERYDQGWRSAEVKRPMSRDVLACIEKRDGRRVWWSECHSARRAVTGECKTCTRVASKARAGGPS